MEKATWYEEVTFPVLLRHARTTYGKAMRKALDSSGYDDIPANGLYIIGGLALEDREVPLRELVRELGITKQGAGQLIDALVMRGYLSRTVDERDRRQLIIALTDRGRSAADIQRQARETIDSKLIASVGDADVLAARRVLAALVGIGHEDEGAGDS